MWQIQVAVLAYVAGCLYYFVASGYSSAMYKMTIRNYLDQLHYTLKRRRDGDSASLRAINVMVSDIFTPLTLPNTPGFGTTPRTVSAS